MDTTTINAKSGMKTTSPVNTKAGQVCYFKFSDVVELMFYKSDKYSGKDWGFRPSSIRVQGKMVWSFTPDRANRALRAEIIPYGDEEDATDYVVYTADNEVVYEVIRLESLTHVAVAMMGDKVMMIGGDTIEQKLDIKIAVAEHLGLQYWFSPEEGKILSARRPKKSDEQIAKEKAKQAELIAKKEAEARARAEFRAKILARGKVEAFSSDGRHYFGIPVTEDAEWHCLPEGTYCILMQNNQPTEAFIVTKGHGTVKKSNLKAVSPRLENTSITSTEGTPNVLRVINATIRNETREVPLFASMADVKTLQRTGLNSGTWVGIPSKDGSRVDVYAVKKGSIATVGILKKTSSEGASA